MCKDHFKYKRICVHLHQFQFIVVCDLNRKCLIILRSCGLVNKLNTYQA